MKTMLKLYVYVCYVLVAPIFLIFSIGLMIWSCIYNLKEYGELYFKEDLEAYLEGVKEGHYINMARIEAVYSDEEEA